ncbi:hypothetical protein [Streptomyces scopuliridis]|uniref:hypothetical protein n=1 Tax=Streptomyces scopuliridis TaxID=452529 RepID=UPI0030B88C04
MKLVVQVKLMPDARRAPAFERTLPAVNDAANWVSSVGFEHFRLKGAVRELRKMCYGELKARGFGAQTAQHIIKRVADAYTTLRASIKAGNLGTEGSKRRIKAESKPIVFRPDAAHTFDDRCLSWNSTRGPSVSGPSTAGSRTSASPARRMRSSDSPRTARVSPTCYVGTASGS